MGLKQNEKYTATKHFRDRLFERYGVVDSQWLAAAGLIIKKRKEI